MLDISEKCKAIGLDATGTVNGLPTFDGVYLKTVGGQVKAFKTKKLKRWETEEEDTTFPETDRQKVQYIADGQEDQLSQDDQDAITAAENEATVEAETSRLEQVKQALDLCLIAQYDGSSDQKYRHLNDVIDELYEAGETKEWEII